MSQSPLEFLCDRCDFSSSEAVEWGYFSYAVSPEPIPVKRELVWCHSCGQPAPGESLASRVGILKRENFLQSARNALQSELARLAVSRTILDRILWWKVQESQLSEELRSQIGEIEKELGHEVKLFTHQVNRKTPARCLVCGSVEIVSFPPGAKFSRIDSDSTAGKVFIHPNCGGTIYSRESRFRVNMRPDHRLYDIEGQFLKTEPGR